MFGNSFSSTAKFFESFESLLWITYRQNFAPLLVEKNKTAKLTSDVGWGCVIRCNQMLLANTLLKIKDKLPKINSNQDIFSLFDDDIRNSSEAAFSIQNIVEVGLNEHNRLPGEWYGVSKMNQIFVTLNDTYNFSPNLSDNKLGNFKMVEFQNGELVNSQVIEAAIGKETLSNLVAQGQITMKDFIEARI
jgi:hypothetical protein